MGHLATTTHRPLVLSVALLFLLPGGAQVATLDPVAVGPASSSSDLARSQVSGPASARTVQVRTTARWSGSVDTLDKATVEAAYQRSFASGLSLPTGWTGNNAQCAAGSTTAASRAATLRALNFTRSLAGLAPVTFNSVLNLRSQRTALLMSANRALSHAPPRSWRCWTSAGAANAGRSNLLLAYPSLNSAGIVSQYLDDLGSTNRAAGHRRWLMNPFATQLGTGSTTTANAITVIGPTSSSRPNPTWVSWPTPGYFPNTLEPAGRWSLSAGSSAISFRYATVRVYRDGTLLHTAKNAVVDGYAQPTLVWQVPTSVAKTGAFRVVVSGVRRAGTTKRYTRAFSVRMFTPSS